MTIKINEAEKKIEDPIIIVALVQSATTFLRNSLSEVLNKKIYRQISGGVWNKTELLAPVMIQNMVNDKGIAYTHCHPIEFNKEIIKNAFKKIIINVRDPRQVMISMIHFIDNHIKSQIYYKSLGFPESYSKKSMEWKINYHIEETYPDLIKWIEGWIEFSDIEKNNINSLTIQQSDLKQNRNAYFKKIYQHYNLKNIDKTIIPEEHDGINHNFFRRGENNEWKETMNTQQINMVNSLLPEKLSVKFNWKI